jgi:hypothetical protein
MQSPHLSNVYRYEKVIENIYATSRRADTLDAEATNPYQQMTGSIMYCSLLRPDLMYYASQLSKVMSRPKAAHMGLA